MILETTDFATGYARISQNTNNVSDLETYIADVNETAIIYAVMGKTEGDLFIADLVNGVPVSAKWTAIFSPFNWNNGLATWYTIGLKDILKYFIYSEFVGGQAIVNQSSGNSTIQQEASSPEDLIHKADVAWNRAVMNVDILRAYMADNNATYPNLVCQTIELNSPI